MSLGPSRLNVSSNHATRVIVVDPDQPDPTALDHGGGDFEARAGWSRSRPRPSTGWERSRPIPMAVSRIFAAKERPAINPVIVHVAGVAQARECVAAWPASGTDAGRTILARAAHARPQPVRESSPTSGDGRPRHRRRARSRGQGRTRPHRTDRASRSPHRARTGRTGSRPPALSMCWPISTVAST